MAAQAQLFTAFFFLLLHILGEYNRPLLIVLKVFGVFKVLLSFNKDNYQRGISTEKTYPFLLGYIP